MNNFGYLEVGKNIFLRFGHWKSHRDQNNGTVCLLGGRTDFMEKYHETIVQLNQRGLEVYSFDWRGQGLSSRLIQNRRKGYVQSYDDYVSDLSSFIDKIFKKTATRPYIVLAHSMGGHITIRFLHEYGNFFDKAVLISPMIDIRTFPIPKYLLQKFTKTLVAAGYDKAYIVGNDGIMANKFRGNNLTSDKLRFENRRKIEMDRPEIAIGGVTCGWLNASFDSIDVLNQPGYVETIRIRILICSAEKDRVVCNKAQKHLCNRLPDCRLVEIHGSQHEILQESTTIQKQFWNIFDRFLVSNFERKNDEKT